MRVTKFTHACVRLDDGDRVLVIDPGAFSEVDEALDGAQSVLITHEHADHLDEAKVGAALERDPRLRLFAPQAVVDQLGERGGQVAAAQPGETFEASGFSVQTFGGQHAVIHPTIPVVTNVGYVVEGVYHPGDAFTVPNVAVQTLLLPWQAPWSKASEVIDFAVAVRAPRVHQIHDSLVTDVYSGIVQQHLERIAGAFGVTFQKLAPRETA